MRKLKTELDLEDWDCASKVVDEDQKNYNTIIIYTTTDEILKGFEGEELG